MVSFGNMSSLVLLIRRMVFIFKRPLTMGVLLLGILFNIAFMLRIRNGFMGILLFIVYVGGIMVLFTYCLIIRPLQLFEQKKYYGVILLVIRGVRRSYTGGLYEFYFMRGLVLIVGVLLFITIIRVVELIDMSSGSLRVE